MCGMIAGAAIISGANRIPCSGAACGRGLAAVPRAGTFARAGWWCLGLKGSDDGTPTTPGRQALGDVAS